MTGFVGRVGAVGNTASATLALTCAIACPIGDTVLVAVRGFNNATPTSVTDSKSNTYTVEDGTKLSAVGAGVYRANLTTALTTSDTITVTFPTSQAAGIMMFADLFASLGTSDANSSASPGSGASPQVLAVTAKGDDYVGYAVEIFSGGGATITPTGSFTAAGTALTSPFSMQTAYAAAVSPGTLTASWTISSTAHGSVLFTRAYPGPSNPGGGFLLGFP
jgi:hypothetical protein